MQVQRKHPNRSSLTAVAVNNPRYSLNEAYLIKLGFNKSETGNGSDHLTYKYQSRETTGSGFELVFQKEYGILSIEEFWEHPADGILYIGNPIVGKFRIQSDEDLRFIFSRNVRLSHIFFTACKKV